MEVEQSSQITETNEAGPKTPPGEPSTSSDDTSSDSDSSPDNSTVEIKKEPIDNHQLRPAAMPVLQQHGKVYIGPGGKKEAQVLGLGLASLRKSEKSDFERAKRFAMDQSIKYLLQKQQQAHQENQQKVAMYAQALSLMARIYIGSISFDVREDTIRETFTQFGPVKSINMSYDASTGHHKGYAFLEFEVPEGALLAQEGMNGIILGGRNIKVERGRVQLQLGRPQTVPQAQPIIDMIMAEARKFHRIYVASVHEDLTETDLRDVFSSFGNILKCQLAKSPAGRHRGFGYLEFDNAKSAQDAIAGMNMFDLGGKLMRVGKCITPPEALSYIVPNTQQALPTAAAMAAAEITARIQAQEAAGKTGKKLDSERSPTPPRKPNKHSRKRRSRTPSPKASPSINGTNGTSTGKSRFGEKAITAPPPKIIDPLKVKEEIEEKPEKEKEKSNSTSKPHHRPSFAPAATVEVKIEEKPKQKKPKDILSRIKLQPTLKPGEKATFAPLTTPLMENVFEDDTSSPQLSITGGNINSISADKSNALAVVEETKKSKQVALINKTIAQGSSENAAPAVKKKKKVTGPKAKGPQLNTVQALEAANKAGALSDQIQQAGLENEEQPLSAMEINEIRGNDARHLLMKKLMRSEQTRVMLLKKMVLPEEVDEYLQGEVKEECEKHGKVLDVSIVQVRDEIRIFVRYEKIEDATKAREIFDKRWFSGRQIEAVPYDEELFNFKDYLG